MAHEKESWASIHTEVPLKQTEKPLVDLHGKLYLAPPNNDWQPPLQVLYLLEFLARCTQISPEIALVLLSKLMRLMLVLVYAQFTRTACIQYCLKQTFI